MPLSTQYVKPLSEMFGASAGTRTRVQALATPGDNHYTTLAGSNQPTERGYKRLSAQLDAYWNPNRSSFSSDDWLKRK